MLDHSKLKTVLQLIKRGTQNLNVMNNKSKQTCKTEIYFPFLKNTTQTTVLLMYMISVHMFRGPHKEGMVYDAR